MIQHLSNIHCEKTLIFLKNISGLRLESVKFGLQLNPSQLWRYGLSLISYLPIGQPRVDYINKAFDRRRRWQRPIMVLRES